jgi:hypothetical protein
VSPEFPPEFPMPVVPFGTPIAELSGPPAMDYACPNVPPLDSILPRVACHCRAHRPR